MDKDSGENAQDAQDARIRNLWQSLGASGTNDCLDYNGLRAGLHKIDHRRLRATDRLPPLAYSLQLSRRPMVFCPRL